MNGGMFMLKRLLSSIVILIVFVPLLMTGGIPFSLFVGILSLLAFKEMVDLRVSHSKIPKGIELFGMMSLLVMVFYEYQSTNLSFGVSHKLIAIFILLFLVPSLFNYKNGEYDTRDGFYLLGVVLLLGVSFNSLIVLRNMSLERVIYLFLIPVCTDVFAYLIGSLFGKRKVAPNISPKKTLEGYIGGCVLGTILPTIYYYYLISNMNIIVIVVLTFVISIMGCVGDLLFSKIKRENGIKDFSNLIPGHGGILDRLDSFIFGIFTYVLLLMFY